MEITLYSMRSCTLCRCFLIPLATCLLAPQIQHLLTLCAFINFTYLLTYLLTYFKTWELTLADSYRHCFTSDKFQLETVSVHHSSDGLIRPNLVTFLFIVPTTSEKFSKQWSRPVLCHSASFRYINKQFIHIVYVRLYDTPLIECNDIF